MKNIQTAIMINHESSIMKNCLTNFVILFVTVLHVTAIPVASAAQSDIRYRSVVYYYPGTVDIDIPQLKKEFKPFAIVDKLPESATRPVMSYTIIKDARESYPVPDSNYLSYFGRGLDKEQATRIEKSNLAIIIDIAYPFKSSYTDLKASTHSLFNFASSTDGIIWDAETRELFTPLAWKEIRIAPWKQGTPNVRDHIVIHAYKNNEGIRAITLGMAKFGLPDIVVNDFSWSLNRPMGNLINLAAQSIAEGSFPDDDGYLELNINTLRDTDYKKSLLPTLKANAEPTVKIQTGTAKREEGDPENYIIELLFQNIKGDTLNIKHETLLSSLFGWEDNISYVKHNQAIKAASQRAKKKLNGLRTDFNKGLAPGEFILLKAPFSTPDGGTEWMWVEVLSWKKDTITGLLKNEPYHIPDLKGGSTVTIKQGDVFDYIRNYPDGTSEGNETGALIMKHQN